MIIYEWSLNSHDTWFVFSTIKHNHNPDCVCSSKWIFCLSLSHNPEVERQDAALSEKKNKKEKKTEPACGLVWFICKNQRAKTQCRSLSGISLKQQINWFHFLGLLLLLFILITDNTFIFFLIYIFFNKSCKNK